MRFSITKLVQSQICRFITDEITDLKIKKKLLYFKKNLQINNFSKTFKNLGSRPFILTNNAQLKHKYLIHCNIDIQKNICRSVFQIIIDLVFYVKIKGL